MTMRKHMRFSPDSLDVAYIDFNMSGDFSKRDIALILTESYGGAGLIVRAQDDYTQGNLIRVQVGKMSPYRAQIKWIKNLDRDVTKIGIEFKE